MNRKCSSTCVQNTRVTPISTKAALWLLTILDQSNVSETEHDNRWALKRLNHGSVVYPTLVVEAEHTEGWQPVLCPQWDEWPGLPTVWSVWPERPLFHEQYAVRGVMVVFAGRPGKDLRGHLFHLPPHRLVLWLQCSWLLNSPGWTEDELQGPAVRKKLVRKKKELL